MKSLIYNMKTILFFKYLSINFKVNFSSYKKMYYLQFFNFCSITVVPIFPHYFCLPYPPPPSTFSPPPLSLPRGPLYLFLDLTLPHCSCYLSHPSPLVTVSLFFISQILRWCTEYFSTKLSHLFQIPLYIQATY